MTDIQLTPKLLIGAFLAVLGLLLTGGNLGLIDPEPFLRYWSVVLIAIGLLRIPHESGRFWGIFWIVAGVWILALNLGWVPWGLRDLWPIILVGAGILLIVQSLTPRAAADDSGGQPFRMFGVLSRPRHRIGTGSPARGSAVAFLGGCRIDLETTATEAAIDVVAFWGGSRSSSRADGPWTIGLPRSWERWWIGHGRTVRKSTVWSFAVE